MDPAAGDAFQGHRPRPVLGSLGDGDGGAPAPTHDPTPGPPPPTASLYTRLNLRRSLRASAPVVRGALVSTDATAAAILNHLPDLEGKLFVTPFGIDHTD